MKDILTSPDSVKIKRERRAQAFRLAGLLFVLLLVAVGALAYFSGRKNVILNEITVTGTHIIDEKEIKSVVANQLNGRYLNLFARNNSLIYPKSEIYNTLVAQYPRISNLDIYRDNWHTLHVSITERQASYLYCGKVVPSLKSEVGENCYFVNNDGYIFDKAPYFSGNVYFRYYAPLPTENEEVLGQYLMPVEDFHKLARFVDNLSSLGFKPTSFVSDEGGAREIHLDDFNKSKNHRIVFSEDNDLGVIFENLSVAMKKQEFADEINSKYDNLEYIDLRFKDKVLYKFD